MVDFPNVLDKIPLLVSGQTTEYTPAGRTCKDDGGEQKGLSKRYTILDAGQYSGTTGITVNAKTDTRSNECVLDRNTGVMYTRTSPGSVGPASDGLLYWDDTAGSDEDIFKYCDQANLAGLAGHTDWRVVNYFEQFSMLVLNLTVLPLVDKTAFPSLVSAVYYTSTTYPNSTSNAMTVSLSGAFSSVSAKTTATHLHLLVRG